MDDGENKHTKYMREWRAKNRDRAREISRAGSARYNAANPERKRAQNRESASRRRKLRREDPAAHRAFLNKLARARYLAKVAADPTYLPRKQEHGKKWREANPELARQVARDATRRWRAANPDKVRAQIERSKEGKRAQQLERRRAMRAALIEFFGGKCVHCPVADVRALHLDHIHGNGNADRKIGKGNFRDQFAMIQHDPEGARAKYQLLCANCNTLKQAERGEYRKAAGL